MAILFISPDDDADAWRAMLSERLPDLPFHIWTPAFQDHSAITHAVAWKPPAGVLGSLPNLKAIHSLGAGVDHILADPGLPYDVPLARLIDRCLTQGMSEYVLYWVIHHHRSFGLYQDQQRGSLWREHPQADAEARRVGILGLGELGLDAATKLTHLHYRVAGWSRSVKALSGIETFHGADGLTAFLARTEILVCLLPLTPETEGLLNRDTLEKLPHGAVLINCARGGHVVEGDLLEMLDQGHLRAATLDVFREEPLPASHPFWSHPKVTVTPHIASLTLAHSSADWIAANIRRADRGAPLEGLVDIRRGY